MTGAGRPPRYRNRDNLPIYLEREQKQALQIIAAREGRSPSEILGPLIDNYIKTHGDGNPSYRITQFFDNPEFKAVPALFSDADRIRQFLAQADFKDVDEIEQKAEEWRKFTKSAKKNKIVEATKLLQKPDSKAAPAKALPETADPNAVRLETLKQLWKDLAGPLQDLRGGAACRNRRRLTIEAIITKQELLSYYVKCQEYEEWKDANLR